jgi:hypothetical protein
VQLPRQVLSTNIHKTKLRIKDHKKMHLPEDTARKEMPKSSTQKEIFNCRHSKNIDIPGLDLNVSSNYSLFYLERTRAGKNSPVVRIDKDKPPRNSYHYYQHS